jgi:predicted PurR-regulated permease PerM
MSQGWPVSEQLPEAFGSDRTTQTIIVLAVRIGCLAVLCYWTLILMAPFLTIIVWSVILAVALYPAFDWLARRVHYRPLAAAIITIVVLLIILGPASKLGYSLVDYVHSKIEDFSAGKPIIPTPPQGLQNWPLIGPQLYEYWNEASTNFVQTIRDWAPELKPYALPLLTLAGQVSLGLLKFIIATIIAGFLFVPGPALVEGARHVLRMVATERGEEFLALAGATIRNVSRGVIGVSLLQALLAGVGMLVAKVPAAGLLSFLVLFLGVIQVGAGLVLVPLIIWSWFGLPTTTAAVLFTLYMAPIALLDNLLRPFVMAKGLTTPMPVILVGVLGGTIVHGILGLFIGPIVLSIAYQLLMVWWRDSAPAIEPAESPPLLE